MTQDLRDLLIRHPGLPQEASGRVAEIVETEVAEVELLGLGLHGTERAPSTGRALAAPGHEDEPVGGDAVEAQLAVPRAGSTKLDREK